MRNVAGQINGGHAAGTDFPFDVVAIRDHAAKQKWIVVEQRGEPFEGGPVHEWGRSFTLIHECLDARAKVRVTLACVVEEVTPLLGRTVEGGVDQRRNRLPTLGQQWPRHDQRSIRVTRPRARGGGACAP